MTPAVITQIMISALAGIVVVGAVRTRYRADRYALGVLIAALCFVALNAPAVFTFISR